MNKRIVAITVLLLMMCAMAASVFAEENQSKETTYKVTVTYQMVDGNGKPTGRFKDVTYTIKAFTAREAEAKAMELCKYDVEVKGLGVISSCGRAIAQ